MLYPAELQALPQARRHLSMVRKSLSSAGMLKKSASIMKVKVEAKVQQMESPLSRNLDLSLFGFARCGRACGTARLGAPGLGG